MKRILLTAVALAAFLSLGGCASDPSRSAVNPDKAAELNAQMGLRYMLQGNYELSMDKLRHSLGFRPDYGPAHHYMAELYRRLGRPQEAERHFAAALKQLPDDSALLNNYGAFLCSTGRYDDAERHFLDVLDNPVYPRRAQVYENLGLCMQRKGDSAKAERYLRQALSLDPRLPKALFAMAEASYGQREYMSARGYLQRYLEVGRHTPETLWLGIRVERVLGDKDALGSYTLLLKNHFPDSEQARLYRESEQR